MSSSTVIHSNAFNFRSYVQHGVDPRTGQYTLSLSVPELKSNALGGPVLPLTLAFSPMNTRDAGYGLGWDLNLTEYNPTRGALALGTGEAFSTEGEGSQLRIKEKKLDSFHFHDDGGGQYRVVHRDGRVEVLTTGGGGAPLALPQRVMGPDGRAVTLGYASFGGDRRLETVSDDSGELLRINRNDVIGEVELLFFPGKGEDGTALARFLLRLDGDNRVTRIVLPTEEQACWKLEYTDVRGIFCLGEVWTPTGAHETVEYDGTGHVFPGDAHAALPRVGRHIVDPRNGQLPMKVEYTYTDTNFLGLGALTHWDDNGEDNLYKVTDHTFHYGSTEKRFSDPNTIARQIERSYNRFHLMTAEVTTQGKCRKRVITRYYADDPENVNRPFEHQPAQCQLPMQIETHWEEDGEATRKRMETSQTRFDTSGNLTERINADGTREVLEYYKAEGEEGCPPDPENFMRHLKSRTVHPAASPYGSAPTLRTEYGYIDLPPVPGLHARRFVAESWQRLVEVGDATQTQDDAELQRSDTDYFDDPTDTLRHGREKSVTATMNGQSTVVGYQYAVLDSARVGQSVLQVVETITGFDTTQRSITQEHSLLNGEPLLVEDDNGVEIRYAYDALQRVVSETVAPDTPYAASRTYAYHLVGENSDDQAWQQLTDVKAVGTRTWVDGQGRAVKEQRQDADAEEEAGRNPVTAPLRTIYEASYDGLGQLIGEVDIDWFDAVDRRYATGFVYDDWGARSRTVRPDKVVECEELDPIGNALAPGQIRRTWLESTAGVAGGITETWLDLFGEPVRTERFDTGKASVSEVLSHRDGLGRLAEVIDALDNRTTHRYDAFSRRVETTLPGNAVVSLAYAAHTAEDLPEAISVNGILLGTQTFDGLDRRVSAVTGGRERIMHYTGGDARPFQVDTPAGHEIGYEYVPQLGEEVSLRTLPGVTADYTYDPQNALLASCTEQGIGLSRTYFSTGQVHTETRKVSGEADELIEYSYTRRGRMQHWKMAGVTQTTTYDPAGRVHDVGDGATLATFAYDTFGRVKEIESGQVGVQNTLDVAIEYDDFGRETKRTFTSAEGERTLDLTYHADDALKTRTLKENGTTVRAETFHYDGRSRLQRHEIEGTELPLDPFGKAYIHQVFVADALDNITRCTTVYADGGRNVTTYEFGGVDPCQVQAVKHEVTQAGEAQADAAILQTLGYDADGNLTHDEAGRTLAYDPLGRLVGVDAPGSSAAAHYAFDALDVLTERTAGGVTERRYYVDGMLSARREGAQQSTYLRAAGHLLAEQMKGGTDEGVVLMATDLSNTVLGEVRAGAEQHVAYSAYGFPSRGPLWTRLAYNGELHETDTGCQLLGNGYRAFNPELKRFNAPDDQSPFARGGLNAYTYCYNNPVNMIDPDGHFAFMAVGIAAAVGFGVGAYFLRDDPVAMAAMVTLAGASLALGAAVEYGSRKTQRTARNAVDDAPEVNPLQREWNEAREHYRTPSVTSMSSTPSAGYETIRPRSGSPNRGNGVQRRRDSASSLSADSDAGTQYSLAGSDEGSLWSAGGTPKPTPDYLQRILDGNSALPAYMVNTYQRIRVRPIPRLMTSPAKLPPRLPPRNKSIRQYARS